MNTSNPFLVFGSPLIGEEEIAKVESEPRLEGRQMVMVLSPR